MAGFSPPASAQRKGDFGAGLVVGSPTAATGKFWIDDAVAVDLGFSTSITTVADVLFQSWSFFPQPTTGKLGAYAGGGLRVEGSQGGGWGFRAVAGANYWMANHPMELFLEVSPFARISPNSYVNWGAGLGARFYFQRF
jgi:hypothetical protein